MKFNEVLDAAAGKAHKAQGESLHSFLASLTTSGAVFGLGIIAHLLLRIKFQRFYSERAHRILKWKPHPLSLKMLFLPVPDPHPKHARGFENYLFDRYLYTVMKVFLLLGLTIIPILLPLNLIDGKGDSAGIIGLDRLSFSNVGISHANRYWAHLMLALFAIVLVCYILHNELRDYNRLRRSLQDDSEGSSLLVISRSGRQLSARAVWRHFHNISGGVYSVTINRNYSRLRTKLRQRDAVMETLEVAETRLIVKANTRRRPIPRLENEHGHLMPLWMKYLRQKDRQSMRLPPFTWLPPLPFLGRQVDTIYHCRSEIARYNIEIAQSQQHPAKFPFLNSAFIRFNRRLSISLAETAIRARIRPSWTLKQGTDAGDMIWSNVSMSWWQQFTRTAIVYFLVATLTLGFALPVAIIGSISQVGYLANVVPWLSWIGLLPSWQLAIIQGVLPPVMISLITAMAPIILRLLASVQGLYSHRAVENNVQFYYFTFLFVQIFLTVSLSAGVTTTIEELADSIETIPTVLAENLPKASNYFFSYIMMHALTTFALTLVQANGLIEMCILSPALDKTPRQKWMRGQNSGLQKWGTFVPVLTNVASIGLIYSVIAPLILVFCTIYFGGLWMIYRSYPPKLSDQGLGVGGIFFPTAVRQLLTGIYFMELCLAGLFFLVRDAKEHAACRAQGIIMIIAVCFTALFQYGLGHENWLSSRLSSEPQLAQVSRGRRMRSPAADIWAFQEDPSEDKIVTSARPILWIPKDEHGIAKDEIYHMTRTHCSIWISSEGAHLDERGCITLDGKPPVVRGDHASMTV